MAERRVTPGPEAAQICLDDDLFLGLRLGYGEAFLKITRCCNNRCRFCCDRTFQDGHMFPLEQAVELLGEGRRRGLTSAVFSGGEPTVHPDFMAMLAAARRMGYERISVITNGRFFCYPGACRQAVRRGMTCAVITLMSDEADVHDHLCGVEGAFEQSVAALRNLVAISPALASVVITVARPAVPRLPHVVRFLHGLGVGGVALHAVAPLPWVEADPEVFFEPHVAAAPLREAVGLARELGMPLAVKNFPPGLLEGFEELITESEEFFPEVRDTEKRVGLFRTLVDPGAEPLCAALDCATCYRRPFCDFLRSLARRWRSGDYELLRVSVGVGARLETRAVHASSSPHPLCLRGETLDHVAAAAREHRWEDRVVRLELTEAPRVPLARSWPALKAVAVSGADGLEEWLEANRELELELELKINASTAPWLLGHQDLFRTMGQRLVLAPEMFERLGDARANGVDLRWLLGEELSAKLCLRSLPPCIGAGAIRRAAPVIMDLDVLGSDGMIDPLLACHLFLREGWYDHSQRCCACPLRKECQGLPVNQLTAFGYGQLVPPDAT